MAHTPLRIVNINGVFKVQIGGGQAYSPGVTYYPATFKTRPGASCALRLIDRGIPVTNENIRKMREGAFGQ